MIPIKKASEIEWQLTQCRYNIGEYDETDSLDILYQWGLSIIDATVSAISSDDVNSEVIQNLKKQL